MLFFTSSRHLFFLAAVLLSYFEAFVGGVEIETIIATVTITSQIPASASLPSFQLLSRSSLLLQPNQPVSSGFVTLISAAPSIFQSASKGPVVSPSTLATTMTLPPPPSQTHSEFNTSAPENGKDYGNVVIRNHCNETLYLASVGVHALGGFRDDTKGWGTAADEIRHELVPGGFLTEPYRITCPKPNATTKGYCQTYDTLYGQGVAMKIARNDTGTDILQVEYSLVKDPMRVPPSTFQRLEFDISLLDCGDPHKNPNAFGGNVGVTDVSATTENHQIKVDRCPGYQNGISVTFPNDPQAKKCRPIKCDGLTTCMSIYTFDRTRPGEPSHSCEEEYRGNMVVDLCAGSN
jgi:hypothetical protein